MGCISSCTTNVSNNWKISVTVAIVSIALVILATQNLNMRHFEGIGHLGSNILLGLGAGIALLAFVIASCKKPSNDKKLQGVEKPMGAAATATSQTDIDKLKVDVRGFHQLDFSKAFDVATVLADNQVLFAIVDNEPVVYWFQNGETSSSNDEATIIRMQKQVSDRLKWMIPADMVDKVCRADLTQPAKTADEINFCRQNIRPNECFLGLAKITQRLSTFTGEVVNGDNVADASTVTVKDMFVPQYMDQTSDNVEMGVNKPAVNIALLKIREENARSQKPQG